MMKKRIAVFLVLPAVLLTGCDDDIELDPYWVGVELPGGPADGLRDLDADSGIVYVVGDNGEAWRRSGETWSELTTGLGHDLTGVAARDDGGAWVCGYTGDDGRLYDYRPDEGWSEVTPADCAYLNEVACNAEGAACAVGSEGQVWLLTEDVWERLTVYAGYLWRSVDVADDGSVLVVGADATGEGAAMLIDGDDRSFFVNDGERLEDCALEDGQTGWAVAANGVVYGFTAEGLAAVVDCDLTLFGVALDPAGTGCRVCGPGGYLAFVDEDGGIERADTPTTENLQDLVFTSSDTGWAAAQTHLLHYR